MPPSILRSAPVPDDLNQQESEAVSFFQEYMDDVQNILRNPRVLHEREERGNFEVFLSNLDSALEKSTISARLLLYHGMDRDIARILLFMLDVNTLLEEGTVSTEFIPHLIFDPAYMLFTPDPGSVLRQYPGKKGEIGILFAYSGEFGDTAISLGSGSGEVLYPRNSAWVTTGYTSVPWGTGHLIIISIEQYGNGRGTYDQG